MNKSQLNRIHDVEIEILDEIVRICEKHHLRYCLVGGTLLGAVRHSGFIPWDDDLDIAMPRKDYDYFIRVCETELNEEFFLHNETSDNNYWLTFIKIRKKDTIFRESRLAESSIQHEGIWVDIFPLDYAQKEKSFMKSVRTFIIRNLKYLISYKNGNKYPSSIKGKIFLSLCRNINNSRITKIQSFLMQRENHHKNSKYYVNYGSQYDTIKQTMPIAVYEPYCKITFEGKQYNAPGKYETLLKRVYGSQFMQLPPIEKRITHNPIRLSFNIYSDDEILSDDDAPYIIGYTTGVFDLFHIGHLNLLKRAKSKCDFLIVGVSTDENVMAYKNKKPVIPFNERISIVEAIRYVDKVVPQTSMNKIEAWKKLHFDIMFHGDDWKGSKMYNQIETDLNKLGCKTIYLPHTEGISSSLIAQSLKGNQ